MKGIWWRDFSRDTIAHDARNEQTLRTHGFAAEVRYDIGNFQLVSLTGLEQLTTFSRGDIDGGYGAVFSPPSGPGEIPFPSETASGIPTLRQFSQEVRLMSTGAPRLAYQFGLYYFHEFVEMEDFNYNTLAGGTLDGMVHQEQEATARAAFGSMTFQWLEDLELSAGLRLSDDAKDYTAWRDAAPAVTGAGSARSHSTKPSRYGLERRFEFALPRGARRTDLFARGEGISGSQHSRTTAVWRRGHLGGQGDHSFL